MQTKHLLRFKLCTVLMFMSFVTTSANEFSETMEWSIRGETRKALVYIPATAKTKPTPIIFAFHGHGGTMVNMYRTRGFEKLWPEAIFICPQGLNTKGLLTDPEGKKSGWVMNNQTEGNRDLQFFDAMLKTLRSNYQIDNSRIYVTGHSNGGGFTYLLWVTRPNEFAAFAPTATAGGKLIPKLKTPKPGFHLMGRADPLVKPAWQKMTYNKMLRVNGCVTDGVKIDSNLITYKGKDGNDFQLFIHSGGHEYPKNANQPIIDFFKKYSKK